MIWGGILSERTGSSLLGKSQIATDKVNAADHIAQLFFGGPPGGLAQAAIGSEGETFRRSEF